MFIGIPTEERFTLHLLAIAAGLFTGAAIFLVNHTFNRYVIGHFREVLARVQEEDYSARVEISGRDMLGMLADDVNATLSQLKEKNDEALHDDLTGLPNRLPVFRSR